MIARANIYFDGYTISPYTKDYEVVVSAGLETDTSVEDTSVTRVGLNQDTSVSITGYWDSVVDSVIRGTLGTADAMTFCVPSNAVQNNAIILNNVNSNYSLGGSAGSILPFSFSGNTSGLTVFGTTMASSNMTSATTVTSTPLQIGAVAAGYVAYANVHAYGTFTGTSIVVKLQSSATQLGTYADRITFSTLTDVGGEHATDTSADTDEWWRVEATTVGGSVDITYVVALGIGIS